MSLPNDGNRVVIITGISPGIGQSIARDFAISGCNVLVTSPNEHELKNIVSDISSEIGNSNRVSYLVGDISEKAFADTLMEEAIKKWGRIDVLINNGKITNNPKITSDEEIIPENKLQQLQQISSYCIPEEYQTSDPLIRGLYYSIKAAVTTMMTNNNGDNLAIINISSCQGCITQRTANSFTEFNFGVEPYIDSMARIETLTKSIALELADKGIRVNGIVPGLVFNDMNEELVKDANKRKYKEKEVPLGRIANPQEISKVVLFLASKEASYITGAMIPVDGGLMLKRPNYFTEVI
ncbi:MAG TPA: SDR family NAD(P)-dependent oxidoreductase [Candidatus Nitrosocosmicus sp.]|nr:SDR family NAD(P)-dependent oxidoreductase [Candidatus Nitrosocosmicus sp.]